MFNLPLLKRVFVNCPAKVSNSTFDCNYIYNSNDVILISRHLSAKNEQAGYLVVLELISCT